MDSVVERIGLERRIVSQVRLALRRRSTIISVCRRPQVRPRPLEARQREERPCQLQERLWQHQVPRKLLLAVAEEEVQ